MNTYIFSSGNKFDRRLFENIVTFSDNFPEFYDVTLDNDRQFAALIQLMGLELPEPIDLNNEDFASIMDLSNQLLPEFTDVEFNMFYSQWLEKTGRDNNMDEYGQLIFLQGVSAHMNKAEYRFLLLPQAR